MNWGKFMHNVVGYKIGKDFFFANGLSLRQGKQLKYMTSWDKRRKVISSAKYYTGLGITVKRVYSLNLAIWRTLVMARRVD